MSGEIIDLRDFLAGRAGVGLRAGTMALWGAEGDSSRFALPLWRVIHLVRAERGIIFSQGMGEGDGARPRPFIALDLAHDPARLELPRQPIDLGDDRPGQLFDRGASGVFVRLGTRDDRVWGLLADGRSEGPQLSTREREDVLFLSGECAGLLFLRSLADEAEE